MAFPETPDYNSRFFPHEEAFSLPRKCISLGFEDRGRQLPDTVHDTEIYGELVDHADRRQVDRQIRPYVFTALEEFNRPLVYLQHELDRREEVVDSVRKSQRIVPPPPPPAYCSACPTSMEEIDMMEGSPLLRAGASATTPATPANAIHDVGYGPAGATSRSAAPLTARFLRNYHPTFRPEVAALHKRAKLEALKVLLKERPTGYQWLTLEFQGFRMPTLPAEPLFVSMALYYVDATAERSKSRLVLSPDTSARVSEALYFDVASDGIVEQFPTMYRPSPKHRPGALTQVLHSTPTGLAGEALVDALKVQEVENEQLVIPQPTSPLTKVRAGAIMVPRNREFRNPSLMLILQVFKVLQGDPDKTHDAYRGPGRGRPGSAQLQANAERLGKFLQPLGMSHFSVYDSAGELSAGLEVTSDNHLEGASASCLQERPLLRTKVGLSDPELMQLALDADGNLADELERLHGNATFRVSEVGGSPAFPQLEDGSIPFRVIDPHLTRSISTPQPAPPIRELVRFPLVHYGMQSSISPRSRVRGSRGVDPAVLEAQMASMAASAIVNAPTTPTHGDGRDARLAERLGSTRVREAEKHITSHPHGAYQNLLFVQPEEVCGFRQRNLAVRIELRDMRASGADGELAEGGLPLRAVFNNKRGPVLVTEQILPVTYHSRSPGLNGQVKIALPLRLSPTTLLYFTVFHVHVKDKNANRRTSAWRNSGLGNIFKNRLSNAGEGVEPFRAADIVARGWLPLMQPKGCGELVHNGYHIIHMDPVRGAVEDDDEDGVNSGRISTSFRTGGEEPANVSLDMDGLATASSTLTMKILVRTASSVHPSDPGLAALLESAPPALGWLHYPKPPTAAPEITEGVTDLSAMSLELFAAPNEKCDKGRLMRALTLCVADTSPRETCEFFFVTMRVLLRILCAGAGTRERESWRDPNRFPKLRCEAFRFLPLLLERATKAMEDEDETEGRNAEVPEFLQAYVDLLYLEEVPEGDAADNHMPTPRGDGSRSRSDVEIDTIAEVLADKVFEGVVEACMAELVIDGATEAAGRRARAARNPEARAVPINLATGNPAVSECNDITTIYENGPPSGRAAVKAAKGLEATLKTLAVSNSYEAANDAQSWHLLGSISAPEAAKWWPWTYEVLITQWHAVLNVLQSAALGNDNDVPGNGAGLGDVAEGDEESETSSSGDAAIYPLTPADLPESFRPALARHAPTLLQLVLKSLALRLCYEGIDPPIMLDNATAQNLGALCAALGAEVMVLPLWQRQALNTAIADFFREFMMLVHPEQVGRALRAYLRVLKKHTSVEDMELRLVLLDRLSRYEHFVVINSPHVHPGGAHLSQQRLRAIITGLADDGGYGRGPHTLHQVDSTASVGSMEVMAELPNHWLAELMIQEVMSVVSLQTAEIHIRDHAVSVLRQLFVSHTYDARYQDDLSRRRIANMYLPLLGKVVDTVEKIEILAPFAPARRDLCACVVFLLQDAPASYLQEIYREMCFPRSDEDVDAVAAVANGGGGGLWRGVGRSSPTHAELLASARVGTVLRKASGVGALAQRMLQVLRLCIDTFEYPGHEGAGANLVPGLVADEVPGGNAKPPVGRSALTALDSMMKHSRKHTGSPASKIHSRLQVKVRQRAKKRSFAGKRRTADAPTNATMRMGGSRPSVMQTVDATKRQCHLAHAVIHHNALALINVASPGIFGDAGGNGRGFLEEVHIYMLHALDVATSDDLLVALLLEAKAMLFRFGAPTFFGSVGNGMQDWCRRLLYHSNARATDVREAAVATLIYFMTACHAWTAPGGGPEVLVQPLLAVAPQVFVELAGPLAGAVGRHASDSTYPHPVRSKAEIRKAFKPIRASLDELKEWQGTPEAGNDLLGLAVADELDGLARTLEGLLEAFFADKLVLEDMEEAALSTPSPPIMSPNFNGSPQLGGLGYLVGPVAEAAGRLEQSGEDVFKTQRALLRAADTFSTVYCPHLRVYYLGRLEAFHASLGNRAEAAVTALAAADTIGACRPLFEENKLWAPQDFKKRIDGHHMPPLGVYSKEHRNRGIECSVRGEANMAFGTLEHLDAGYRKFVEKAANIFCAIPLPLHAVDAFGRLTPKLAEKRELAKMGEIHQKMTAAFAVANTQEMLWRAGEFAGMGFAEGGGMRTMGNFYRVLFFGAIPSEILGDAGVPAAQVGNRRLVLGAHAEFVYRFPPMVQITTAKKTIADVLTRELGLLFPGPSTPGPTLEVLPDRADEKELLKNAGIDKCFVKITLVRPVPLEIAQPGEEGDAHGTVEEMDVGEGGGSGEAIGGFTPTLGERYAHFEYSIPFTASGKSQGSTAQQCKKRTFLSVKGAFPSLVTRLRVQRRRMVLLSPLDCAADDLRQRSVQMRMELLKPPDEVDKQALKGLVGGSVIPQVNGGAMEIAETFLSRQNLGVEVPLLGDAAQLHEKRVGLGGELSTFLGLCQELVYRTRRILGVSEAMIQSGLATEGEVENPDVTWQREVERGLEHMKAVMKPMLAQYGEEGNVLREMSRTKLVV